MSFIFQYAFKFSFLLFIEKLYIATNSPGSCVENIKSIFFYDDGHVPIGF